MNVSRESWYKHHNHGRSGINLVISPMVASLEPEQCSEAQLTPFRDAHYTRILCTGSSETRPLFSRKHRPGFVVKRELKSPPQTNSSNKQPSKATRDGQLAGLSSLAVVGAFAAAICPLFDHVSGPVSAPAMPQTPLLYLKCRLRA